MEVIEILALRNKKDRITNNERNKMTDIEKLQTNRIMNTVLDILNLP
jgi:hypothetical protein